MRHMLGIIVLAISVAGLASCAKSVHSTHWYEQHAAARKATNKECDREAAADYQRSLAHAHPHGASRECRNAAAASKAVWQMSH